MYHVIANPVAGRKKVNQTYVETLKYLKEASIEHILYETKEYEDPLQVAKQIDKAYPNGGKMIVIGGMGQLMKSLMDSPIYQNGKLELFQLVLATI